MAEASFNLDVIYWDAFPEHKIIFKEEYESEIDHKFMWASRLYCHPSSEFSNYSHEEKVTLISSNYLRDKDFDWSTIEEIIKKYKHHCLTPEERMLVIWKDKIFEKAQILEENKYTMENSEAMDKVINSLPKQWDIFEKVQELYNKAQSKSRVQGDSEEALFEKGL